MKENLFFIEGPAGKLEVKSVITPDSTIHDLSYSTIGIICHPHPLYEGTMDNKVVTTIVRAWQDLNIATVRFNFRGVGQSEGRYGDVKGEIQDLLVVMDWFESRFPKIDFFLAGFSFGSYITRKVAAEKNKKIKMLLSIAPPVNHFDFRSLPLPSCPWFIMQGDNDQIVPFIEVEQCFEDLKKIKNDLHFFVIKDGDHFFHGKIVELRQDIEAIMAGLLSQ